MSRLRFSFLPVAALFAAWLITACDSADPTIPTINTPPVAQAGGPYTGVVGQSTLLDGSGSSDQEGAIASYAWTIEDGGPTALAGASPAYQCTAPGTFTVTLIVRDGNGAQDSDTGEIACVVVNDLPTANPGGPYVSRIGQDATLDGTGSADVDGTVVSWQWTVEDGLPTVLDGETVTYSCTVEGEFVVRLTVADDGGDTGTATTTLECVRNVPPTAVTGGPFSVRIGDQAFLDARASADPDGSIVSYRWQVDDGGPRVFNTSTAFYRCTSAATFAVTLTVTDNEGATGTETTTLDCVANVPPVADPGGPYSADLGTNVTLDGSGSDDPDGSIVSWVWSIADPGSPTILNGETVTYACSTEGTFGITLTVADNEGGTSTGTTQVTCIPNQPPTAATGGPYSIRQGRTGTLDGRGSTDVDGTIVSYAWSLDGGAPFSTEALTTYTCTAVGEFDLTLTVTDNDGDSGSATTTLQCVANVAPTADPGGPYAARVGESVTLDGSASEDPDGVITSWSWSVADGGPPTLLNGQTANYTCEGAGTFDVILTVSDNDGATDQDATTVACQANALPTADAGGPYSGTVGTTVDFDGTDSSDPDGTISAWNWTIADPGAPTLLTGAEPGYPCTVAGTFNVTLVVTDDDGDVSAPSQTTVECVPDNVSPTAEANGPYSATFGAFVTLSSAGSSDPDGTITSWAWLVSDPGGSTLSGPSPNYTCPSVFPANDYTVTLTVTDDDGATGTDTAVISCTEPEPVNQRPTADAGGPYPNGVVGGTIDLDGTDSSDPDGDPLTYDWAVGGTTFSTEAQPSYSCTVAGEVSVTLTVSDGEFSDDDTVVLTCDEPVPANQPPTADAGGPYPNGVVGGTIDLDGTDSSDPDGDPITYDWAVGGTTFSTEAQPSYSCTVAGEVSVTLTVSDGEFSDDDAVLLTCDEPAPANQRPTANAGGPYPAGVVGGTINLDGTASSDPDGDPISYDWAVGGITFSTEAQPSYSCTAAGEVSVTLTVSDGELSDEATVLLTCNEPDPAPTNVSVDFEAPDGGSLPNRIEEGSTLAYRVRVQNTSTVPAQDVSLTVTIDPDAEDVSASDLVAQGNVWSGSRPSIQPGEAWDVVFRMIVEDEEDSPHLSTAEVSAPDDGDDGDDRVRLRLRVVDNAPI